MKVRTVRILSPLFLILALSACAPAEEKLREELAVANRCDSAEDCVLIGSVCPFDCYIYVHKDEAQRMKAKLDAFETDCTYSCIASEGVACEAGKCVPITEPPPADPEGNVGAACTSSEECNTPASYLMRSSCPFGSACIDGACAVVCPMASQEMGADGLTQQVTCTADSDCNCSSYLAQDLASCRCADGSCVAVVAEEAEASE